MKNYRSTIVGFGVLVVLMTAGAAQSLSGSNTVYTDDIVNNHVTNADLGPNSVSRSKIADNAIAGPEVLDNSLTGSDIDEGTLQLPIHATSNRTINSNIAPGAFAYAGCPAGYIATGGGDPNDGATSSEDGGVNIGGTYTNSGEVPVGWAVRNTSSASATISVQVICLKF